MQVVRRSRPCPCVPGPLCLHAPGPLLNDVVKPRDSSRVGSSAPGTNLLHTLAATAISRNCTPHATGSSSCRKRGFFSCGQVYKGCKFRITSSIQPPFSLAGSLFSGDAGVSEWLFFPLRGVVSLLWLGYEKVYWRKLSLVAVSTCS